MKIGIISPSAGTMALYPKRAERGVQWIKKQGWDVSFGENAGGQCEYLSASSDMRVSDIHKFLESDVDLIMASIGGYNSNQLLELLDYKKISNSKKVFCGYSDVTALLLAIAIKGNVRCIYGPTFLPEICEYPEPYKYTVAKFLDVFQGKPIKFEPPELSVDEFVEWNEEEQGRCKVKQTRNNNGWMILQKGFAEGPMWGGNLQTLLWIIGTQYFPLSILDGSIFFFEDLETNVAVLDAMMYSLKLRGVFERIIGLIIGKFASEKLNEQMCKLIPNIVDRADIPIICNVDVGHVNPKISIPLGEVAILDVERKIKWSTNGFLRRQHEQ